MSNPKLTQWFDGSKFVPAHVGVYQRDYSKFQDGSFLGYCKWDGENWISFGFYTDYTEQEKYISLLQNINWRGLAEQPK